MEASLVDLTRGLDLFGPTVARFGRFHALDPEALEVDIEVVCDDDEEDAMIECVFEYAPAEDAFADPWFAAHDEHAEPHGPELRAPESNRSLHAIICFGLAVALAVCLHASTL